jgi:hypothetical protein
MKVSLNKLLIATACLICSNSQAAVIARSVDEIWHSNGSGMNLNGPFITLYDVDDNGIPDFELRSESSSDPETGASIKLNTLTPKPGFYFWTTISSVQPKLQLLSSGDIIGPSGSPSRWSNEPFQITALGGFGGQYDDPFGGHSEAILGYCLTINNNTNYGVLSASLFGTFMIEDTVTHEVQALQFPQFSVLRSLTESDSGVAFSVAAVPEPNVTIMLSATILSLLCYRRKK